MPNRDGSGPFGDGRPGRGLGNCTNSRRSVFSSQNNKTYSGRGYANGGVTLLVDALRYFFNRQSRNRR